MGKKSLLIAGLLFPTTKDCDAFARNVIRDQLHAGQSVPRDDHDWVRKEFVTHHGATLSAPSSYEFVHDLFRKRYGGWSEKAPKPIADIRLVHVLGTPCFQFEMIDGTTVEPSMQFRSGKPEKYKVTDARAAFRFAIARQVDEERDRVLKDNPTCALNGRPLTRDTVEMDHYPVTFAELLRSFLKERDLRAEDVPLREGQGGAGAELDDADLLIAWLDYHRDHAHLRAVHRKAHVAHTTGAPIPNAPKPDLTADDLDDLFGGK